MWKVTAPPPTAATKITYILCISCVCVCECVVFLRLRIHYVCFFYECFVLHFFFLLFFYSFSFASLICGLSAWYYWERKKWKNIVVWGYFYAIFASYTNEIWMFVCCCSHFVFNSVRMQDDARHFFYIATFKLCTKVIRPLKIKQQLAINLDIHDVFYRIMRQVQSMCTFSFHLKLSAHSYARQRLWNVAYLLLSFLWIHHTRWVG